MNLKNSLSLRTNQKEDIMGIKAYKNNDGKTLYKIYINLRSRIDPRIRVQLTEKNIESKGRAERREKELTEEAYREIHKREGSAPTFAEIVAKWEILQKQLQSIQADTLMDYVACLRIWAKCVWDKRADEITRTDVRTILNFMIQEKKSNGFQIHVLNRFKRIYDWGREENLFKSQFENITNGIRPQKVKEKVPDILSQDEIKTLLQRARAVDHPWYPIWAFAVLTGMRNGELFALRWEHVDITNSKLLVSTSYNRRQNVYKSTKSGAFRTIPMNSSLKTLLLELQESSKDEFVLPRLHSWKDGKQASILKSFCAEIGIRPIRFHALRACFSTQLLLGHVSPAIVMKVCGWRELATMERYTRLSGVYEKGATNCLDHLTPENVQIEQPLLENKLLAIDGLI